MKFRMIFLTILSSIVMNFTAVHGQNMSFYSLTTQDGLSHIKVNDIYNDEYGMVWVGTDYGLNRYDGHSVEVFTNDKNDPSTIPHDRITRITGDGNGHLWFICAPGLVELNLNTMKFSLINKGVINSVAFNKDDNSLYIAKGRKVLRRGTGNKFLEVVSLGVASHISDILINGKTVFAGTSGQGVWKINLDNKSQECIVSATKVTRLYIDSREDVWAGSWEDGLCRISGDGQITMFRHDRKDPDSIKSDFVRSCCEDDSGRLWIGTDIGLECYDTQTGQFNHHYRQNDSFSKINHPSIWCMTRDTQGNIWLGSYFGGVNWFNPEYEVYTWYKPSATEGEGLSFPVVGCIQEDKRGNLWIATEGGGVNYLDRRSGRTRWYTKKDGLTSDNIQSLYYDQENETLWIGTHMGGMNRLNIRRGTVRHCFPSSKRPVPVTQSIIKDIVPYKDSLIIGTHNGVYIFDPKTEKSRRMLTRDDIRKAAVVISDLHIDQNENLWISIVNKGVMCHHLPSDRTVWFHQPGDGSISDSNIKSITHDDNGNIWFSTSYSGIDMYSPVTQKFYNYNSRNSTLASDHMYTLTRSVASRKLLISTPVGFYTFDPVTKKSVNYNKNNGFPLTDINDNSIYVTRDSTVFIGSIHGMVSFKEGGQYLNKKPYRITMSRLIVNGKEVTPGDNTGILSKAISSTTSLKLSSNAVLFSIEVSTSDYLSADRSDLQYCLDGFSDEWNSLRQNTITYSNLAPGKYTLHIKPLYDKEDICREVSLEILVQPPWYATWWAITMWILLILTATFLVTKLYNRSIKMRDTEELNQSKLNFFTNISHEIRTPLTVIIAQVENLIYSKEFTPSVYNKVLSIYKNSVHLKSLISELLEFRKQEKGELKIKATPNDIVKMVSEFYLVFEEYAHTRQITLKMEKESNHLEVWYDSDQLQKVLRNLLSNALKYTEPGGEVNMFIGMSSNSMLLKVSDTGRGMSEEEKAHIFDNFYRIERADSSMPDGTGIGLALAKGIVEQHHGSISVESQLGKGTTFTVTLPLGYSHFKPEEIGEDNTDTPGTVLEETAGNSDSVAKDKTMLIVDDNEAIRALLVDIFTPFYRILTAADGEKGWEIVQEEIPDIVVSDVLMPKLPGTELCRKIKSEVTTCHIPVVLLTARVDIEQNIEGLVIGADDYIAKPFNTRLLISRCNNLVNSRIILQEKFSQNPETPTRILATNMIDQKIIDKATAIVEANLDNSGFNVNTFAHEMALSRTNLFTKLKAITGQTPNEFVMTLRLKKAAHMLKNNPELSIVEIADRTGFNSVKYFSKCFNDVYHIRPANYRSKS